MSKVKAETAAETAKNSRKTAKATDAKGRVITVSPLNALQYYNVVKAMGSSAENKTLVDFAMIAATVRRINTTDYSVPSNEKDVQFLIQELDFDGIIAAGEALSSLNKADEENAEGEAEAVKNSVSGPISG